jgi:hypothetical protein
MMTNADNTLPILTAKVPLAEAVKKGDIIVLGDNGKGRFAVPPDHADARWRPVYEEQTLLVQNEEVGKFISDVDAVEAAANRAIASIHTESGTTQMVYVLHGKVVVAAYDAHGVLVNKSTLGTNDGQSLDVDMKVLSNGQVAVACSTGIPSCLTVAVLNENGEVVGGPNTLENINLATSLSMAALPGGNFVLGFGSGEKCTPQFAIFNQMAEVEVSPTVVEEVEFNQQLRNAQGISVVGLGITGFAYVYGRLTLPTATVQMQMYDVAGHKSQPLVQVGQPLTDTSVGPYIKTCVLRDGNFAVASYGGQGPGFQLQLFTGTGTAEGACHVVDNYDGSTSANRIDMAALADGNLGVVWTQFGNGAGSVLKPNGEVLFRRAGYGPAAGSVKIAALPEGGAVVAMQSADGLKVGTVDKLLYGELPVTRLPAGLTNAALIVEALPNTYGGDAKMVLAGAAAGMVQFGLFATYSKQAALPIGVATADAEDGEVEVVVQGKATLRLPFKMPFKINLNEKEVPGQKLAVIGDLAILHGIG